MCCREGRAAAAGGAADLMTPRAPLLMKAPAAHSCALLCCQIFNSPIQIPGQQGQGISTTTQLQLHPDPPCGRIHIQAALDLPKGPSQHGQGEQSKKCVASRPGNTLWWSWASRTAGMQYWLQDPLWVFGGGVTAGDCMLIHEIQTET